MVSIFKRWLTPPVFEDEIKTQQAYLLHIILWTLICVPIPFVIYTLTLTPENINRTFTQAFFGETVNIFLLYLLRHGHVRVASIIQVSAFWFFFTATAVTGGGVQGESYLLGYGLVIAIAGILLGGTGAVIFTALSLVAGGLMANAQTNGTLNLQIPDTPVTTWIVSLVLFPIGAVVQYLASRTVRHALARARASEEKYRLISSVSSDYTFSTELDSDDNMRLEWVAGAFERITGYTYEEYVANGGWRAHLHPGDLEKDTQDTAILKTNQQVITEIRTYTKDGELRWVRVYAHPVWSAEQNRLVGIVGAVQDITDKKQAEQEREELITELEKKNAELERFTYSVSHDLKSPLITITGFLTFLEKDAISGRIENLKASIMRISQAAEKMRNLLDDLLELSRVGRLVNPPESVPFRKIVEEALDAVRGQLDIGQVEIEIQKEFPFVSGDHTRLVEVMQNLIDNAVKFMGEQKKPYIEIGTNGCDENGLPIFFVRDNGIGINPQYHERVFGLFNKLNPAMEGTGIGLTLTKRIVEVHGGHIWLESQENQGTTVYFTLANPPDSI